MYRWVYSEEEDVNAVPEGKSVWVYARSVGRISLVPPILIKWQTEVLRLFRTV